MVKVSDIVKYVLVAGIVIGGAYFTLKYIYPEFKKLFKELFGEEKKEEYPEIPTQPPTYTPPTYTPPTYVPPEETVPTEARITVSQIYVY